MKNKSNSELKNIPFPTNIELWKWFRNQKYQTEQGEQEYTMIYECDIPKILKDFHDYLTKNI